LVDSRIVPMKKVFTVSRKTVEEALRHLRDGVSILDMDIPRDMRDRIERVGYVWRRTQKHPELDAFTLLKQLAAGRYSNSSEEWHVAKKDLALFHIIGEKLSA